MNIKNILFYLLVALFIGLLVWGCLYGDTICDSSLGSVLRSCRDTSERASVIESGNPGMISGDRSPITVTPVVVTPERARALVGVRLDSLSRRGVLTFTVSDADGRRVCVHRVAVRKGALHITYPVEIDSPHLWSPSSPYIYKLEVESFLGGRVVREGEARIIFREVSFVGCDTVILNGAFLQSCNVSLDPSSDVDTLLTVLKDMGCNAIVPRSDRTGFGREIVRSSVLGSSLDVDADVDADVDVDVDVRHLVDKCDELGFILLPCDFRADADVDDVTAPDFSRKELFYKFRSRWKVSSQTLHLSAVEGGVRCRTSYPSAELFADGSSLGVKENGADSAGYRSIIWECPPTSEKFEVVVYDSIGVEMDRLEVNRQEMVRQEMKMSDSD